MSEQDRLPETAAEWRERLTDDQYRILREAGTEARGTSPLLEETRDGTFRCAGCGQALFDADTKFDSGTGWPSFWAPVAEDAVTTEPDPGLLGERTEVLCSRCEGHLGHVFEDGPDPTGLRYCMNGVALTFDPAEEA
jgi:peptide-methionine (R)-S-oxide reductase